MEIITVNGENFDEKVRNAQGPVLVDFYATWCGPCKMLAPILEQVAGENENVTIAKLDIDEGMELAKEFGVTRVCVNPQTLCDEVLQGIGRSHSTEDFLRAYDIFHNKTNIVVRFPRMLRNILWGQSFLERRENIFALRALSKRRWERTNSVQVRKEICKTRLSVLFHGRCKDRSLPARSTHIFLVRQGQVCRLKFVLPHRLCSLL